ncbi:MAG: alanine/glycine:cation symporter family protein [Gammaproteobacteria bacterium]
MQVIQQIISFISDILWGDALGFPLLVPLLAGVGIFLTCRLRFLSLTKLPTAFKLLWQGRATNTDDAGDIPPFQALMTALSATIGTGNIAGVATAIYLGGPGAIFWMWIIALFGMATKYAEAVLAVTFRETDELGNYVGGPMYYIKNGLQQHWHWLGASFALFGMFAGFGIGATVQSNTVATQLQSAFTFSVPTWVTGLLLATLVGIVIIGGIRRIAEVAARIVPFMGVAYFFCALLIIVLHIGEVPAAITLIVSDAFTGSAASGGFAGASVWMAIRMGAARGIFSNEAGLGSAPIAHAAARTSDPVKQGMIAMLGTFIDTIIICTMTGLAIILTGVWTSGANGAPMSSLAFSQTLGVFGEYIITFGLCIFAFTTMLGWSYYGERCGEYLFGVRIIKPFRAAWVIAIFLGAVLQLELVWLLADVLNGLMALPNLLALILLSPVIVKVTGDYLREHPA